MQSIPPKIVSFKLLKSNNQSLNHDYSSKVEGTFGIVIDDDNNIIKVNMEIPLESDTKSAELVPTIAFNGDSLKVKVGDSGFREYDVRSNESIDFYNNDVFLETSNYAGEVKTYKVEIDTNVFPSITNLGVLSRNENSTTSFIIPNKKDVLTAKFDFGFEPEGYKVRWYAENKNLVSNPEELLSNYTQGKYIPDLVIDNSNILDLSEYSMLIDEYIVFFDVVSVIENGKIGEAHCSLGTR